MKQSERLETLATINDLDNILDMIADCNDMYLSDVRKLQKAMWQLRNMVKVAPQKSEDGDHPNHGLPLVLADDSTAWIYKG